MLQDYFAGGYSGMSSESSASSSGHDFAIESGLSCVLLLAKNP
jgi:hypothetical protein